MSATTATDSRFDFETTYCTSEEAQQVAGTIRSALGVQGLATLGASDLGCLKAQSGALVFVARILPFNKDGQRAAQPRKMVVTIALNGCDEFIARVHYYRAGEMVLHYQSTEQGMHLGDLQKFALALDYDGEEVLNPRFGF